MGGVANHFSNFLDSLEPNRDLFLFPRNRKLSGKMFSLSLTRVC